MSIPDEAREILSKEADVLEATFPGEHAPAQRRALAELRADAEIPDDWEAVERLILATCERLEQLAGGFIGRIVDKKLAANLSNLEPHLDELLKRPQIFRLREIIAVAEERRRSLVPGRAAAAETWDDLRLTREIRTLKKRTSKGLNVAASIFVAPELYLSVGLVESRNTRLLMALDDDVTEELCERLHEISKARGDAPYLDALDDEELPNYVASVRAREAARAEIKTVTKAAASPESDRDRKVRKMLDEIFESVDTIIEVQKRAAAREPEVPEEFRPMFHRELSKRMSAMREA